MIFLLSAAAFPASRQSFSHNKPSFVGSRWAGGESFRRTIPLPFFIPLPSFPPPQRRRLAEIDTSCKEFFSVFLHSSLTFHACSFSPPCRNLQTSVETVITQVFFKGRPPFSCYQLCLSPDNQWPPPPPHRSSHALSEQVSQSSGSTSKTPN